jgi:hypothetical protein
MSAMPKRDIEQFISHWKAAPESERQISQTFLLELCDLLDVEPPGPQHNGSYTFEFPLAEKLHDGTTKARSADLYRRHCFLLESKKFQDAKPDPSQLELTAQKIRELAAAPMGPRPKGKKSGEPRRDTPRWDAAMEKAYGQAANYIRLLPDNNEPFPPFMLVVDVGNVIEVRADFSQSGKTYTQFPDSQSYRIRLEQLRDPEIRARLKSIWTNPLELDPSKRSAKVTKEVAEHLATLAQSFEKQNHPVNVVAEFLTRCLFCMFAEDVGLLPNSAGEKGFTALLKSLQVGSDGKVEGFETMLRTLFKEMNEGRKDEISVILRRKLLKFNGGLFAEKNSPDGKPAISVLPVNADQLAILIEAAEKDWQLVEPAIFGTLLERALGDEGERHKLGAHFTPREYVERLVLPTVVEPLRTEWESVRAAAVHLGDRGDIAGARTAINRFHDRLCQVKVLDPACGSGNFLYVALEHLKRLEGEVFDFGAQFGETSKLEAQANTVDPHQFLGLEINPRAASIAEMVLWIGYLQWHFRTRGQTMPAEPVLKNFKNIQCRDAVLAYDGEPQPARDEAGNVKTVWDRRSMKTDTVTGREVPDETKRVPLLTYANPRPATWPEADFIVGNPPFIGKLKLREDLGDGYAETLRAAYPEVPDSADFVLYWWHKAAELVRTGKARRFGLITTNSLRQTFARRVVQTQLSAKPPLSLAFAIPDHPWVDTAEGAAVRIAMTVGVPGEHAGDLMKVTHEEFQEDGTAKVSLTLTKGRILSDLRIGAEINSAVELKANDLLAGSGLILGGRGFVITASEAEQFRKDNKKAAKLIFPLRNGDDLAGELRNVFVIDTNGWTEDQLRSDVPEIYQRLRDTVYSERQVNPDPKLRKNWWLFRRSNELVRGAISGLSRFIATPETTKHRFFTFLEAEVKPEHRLVVIGTDDAFYLGVLSSRIHLCWASACSALVGPTPVYPKTICFDRFPFPLCGEREQARIRELAEALDAHRKQVQAKHGITLTGLYNVLEKIRAGETLTEKEKFVHERGLVSTLKSLHDDLDAAVSAAYGWPASLTDAEILDRLVVLNKERAAEERRGVIHWLRPEYQDSAQSPLKLTPAKPAKKAKAAPEKTKGKAAWPKSLPERVQAVETALHVVAAPIAPEDLAKQFARAKPADVLEILKTLETLGRARRAGEGTFRP